MAEPKTKVNDASVLDFIDAIGDERQRDDAQVIHALMQSVSGKKAKMFGSSIVGFDSYHYVYASGREGDWPILAFSPRKQSMTVYTMDGFKDKKVLLKKLGKHKTSVSCLYFKKLADLHLPTFKALLKKSYASMSKKYKK
ncbi:MAG: DUF1801 domain-containing protein [Cytophagales bacterium]|nr:DUF1801 domain-containing protein [Cytophagales bacterium]